MSKIIFLVLSSLILVSTTALGYDLTGDWRCNMGGDYYIRQSGNTIWWYGEGSSWSNVAHGNINGNIASLSWTDVPKGRNSLIGTLSHIPHF
jgi:hypothetical protein